MGRGRVRGRDLAGDFPGSRALADHRCLGRRPSKQAQVARRHRHGRRRIGCAGRGGAARPGMAGGGPVRADAHVFRDLVRSLQRFPAGNRRPADDEPRFGLRLRLGVRRRRSGLGVRVVDRVLRQGAGCAGWTRSSPLEHPLAGPLVGRFHDPDPVRPARSRPAAAEAGCVSRGDSQGRARGRPHAQPHSIVPHAGTFPPGVSAVQRRHADDHHAGVRVRETRFGRFQGGLRTTGPVDPGDSVRRPARRDPGRTALRPGGTETGPDRLPGRVGRHLHRGLGGAKLDALLDHGYGLCAGDGRNPIRQPGDHGPHDAAGPQRRVHGLFQLLGQGHQFRGYRSVRPA